MLRTVEATFDPCSGVHFIEPVTINRSMRVLVTFLESGDQIASPVTSDKRHTLREWLTHDHVCTSSRTPETMEQYIQELRSSWE